MLNAIPYASCYVYSPGGAGAMCERSRLLRSLLKEGDAHFMLKYALRVHQQSEESAQLGGFFCPRDVLVPVPGSRPAAAPAASITAQLADAMVQEGLGCATWIALRRIKPVPKSGTAMPGARPSVRTHYDSFLADCCQAAPRGVLLIDDVITKGRTLLAAASRLQEAFPGARIRAFALLRTLGRLDTLEQLILPCRGEIRWRGGDARRSP